MNNETTTRAFVRVITKRVAQAATRVKQVATTAAKILWKTVVGVTKVAAHAVGVVTLALEEGLLWAVMVVRVAAGVLTIVAQLIFALHGIITRYLVAIVHKVVWGALLVLRTPSMLFYGGDVAKTDWGLWLDSWKLHNFDIVESGEILLNEQTFGLDAELEHAISHHPASGKKGRPTPKQHKKRPAKLRLA